MNPPRLPRASAALHNLPNVGNSCYVSATLAALFLATDAYDGLLTPSPRAAAPLRHRLARVVAAARAGRRVPSAHVAALLDALRPAWRHDGRQHDAAEFLAHLLDALRAPFLPLTRRISHDGARHRDDDALCTERVLWLPIPRARPAANVADMLRAYFDAQRLDGLRRGGRTVAAVETRALIPDYAAERETGDATPAERFLFAVIAVPLAIRRFDARGSKLRSSVHVPVQLPARPFLHQHAPPDAPPLLTLCAVVCHRGASRAAGHYVAYTRAGASHWRRWDDMHRAEVEMCDAHSDGLPALGRWRDEMTRDAYLLLYQLGDGRLPGDQRAARMQILTDRKLAEQEQFHEDEYIAQQMMMQVTSE